MHIENTVFVILLSHMYVCSIVLLCCRFKIILFVFLAYPDIMLYYFLYAFKVISHSDISLSSDIFLDSLLIEVHVL